MQGFAMTANPPCSMTPNWLAHRYDPGQDSVHFIEVDREARGQAPFLTDADLGEHQPYVVRRAETPVAAGVAPVRYIFHSAFCCSTLLANAYDRPGLAFSLKEPAILQDLVGWRHRGGAPAQIGAVMGDVVRLLARPFNAGEACVIKPSNVVNGFIPALLGGRNDLKALMIYAPLHIFIGSIAKKGLTGRLWVRDLLVKQLKEGFVDLGFTAQDYFQLTDLQIAAVGWLAQHVMFARVAAMMSDRVRTLDSEVLLARSGEALAALDALFEVSDSAEGRAAVIERVFSRNSKTGDVFDASNRRADQDASLSAYRDEIDKVVIWAEKVAEGVGISLTLPESLLR
jgi:hypothetical protein